MAIPMFFISAKTLYWHSFLFQNLDNVNQFMSVKFSVLGFIKKKPNCVNNTTKMPP